MFWRTKNVKFYFRWGTKPRDQNRRLGIIVTSFLSHFLIVSSSFRQGMIQKCVVYKKIRKCPRHLFSAKLEVLKWRRNHTFPVLLFSVSRLCTPPEVKFDAFGTSKHGEGKSLSNNSFATLISTLGRFNRANKKNSVIYTLSMRLLGSRGLLG